MLRTASILGTVLLVATACGKKVEEDSDTLSISSETILAFQDKRGEATAIDNQTFGD